MTRTLSPRLKRTLCFGRSPPDTTCWMMALTCSSGIGVGRTPGPTNPVTLGVFLIRYQRSSDMSIRISTYPGKNLREASRRLPFFSSTTVSVGISTCETASLMPRAATRCSMLCFTLFSNPE